jgi:D-beta-D-heptose 7-phosphate kinase/D-beta-D-heptose 1-phosphate adenosyltransferase
MKTWESLHRDAWRYGLTPEVLESWREEEKSIVFTNGCFDVFHDGHLHLLHAAAEQGDRLIVAVNSDESVRRLKGNTRPINPLDVRCRLLYALRCVDAVVTFDEDTPVVLINTLKPAVLVKGSDSPRPIPGELLLPEWGGRLHIVQNIPGLSSTQIVDKIKRL